MATEESFEKDNLNIKSNINRLEKDINSFERDYVVFKTDISSTLKQLTNNITLLTKNVDKMIDIEKSIIKITHDNDNQKDKVKKIEAKIDWISKLIIGTIIVAVFQSFYSINKEKIVYIDSVTNKVVKKT